jgi:hypothetical protein
VVELIGYCIKEPGHTRPERTEEIVSMMTGRAIMTVRRNFAGVHLISAVRAAKRAHAVESDNDTTTFGDWYTEMMEAVPVAIVMSGASLEASANELLEDILQGRVSLSVSSGMKKFVEELKADRSGNSLGKFQRIAWIFDKIPDKGCAAWQNAQILVSARNSLMHFRPTFESSEQEDNQESEVAKGLKGRVPVSPVHRSSPLVFPHSFMTYGCAKWAVTSVREFYAYLSGVLGLPDKYASFGFEELP